MIKSYFQIYAYDQDHSYVRQTRKHLSRSFVQAFLKIHFLLSDDGATTISITDVDGGNYAHTATNNIWNISYCATAPGRGGVGLTYGTPGFVNTWGTSGSLLGSSATNNGIVVGTGTTAVTPTDFQLATLVTDGITAGKLEYFTCAGTNLTTSGTAGSFDIERLYRNSSGGTITINEIGIYTGLVSSNGSGVQFIKHFCVIRDLVSPGFAVANGEYMRTVYTLTVTA